MSLLFLIGAVACASAARVGPDNRPLAGGTWGGDHAALTVTAAGAHIEFDCAFGDIATPVTVDADGRLGVDGTYSPEQGGPIRSGEKAAPKAARYSGRLSERTLALDVTLTESRELVGHFTLTLGAEPRVFKCK